MRCVSTFCQAVTKPTIVTVLGGPGAGKGTQCRKIVEHFGFVHLSAGELLRVEMNKRGSEHGELISMMTRNGQIVPSFVTVSLIENAINASGKSLFLIDGFPRNAENNQAWEKALGSRVNFKFLLFFDVDEKVLQERLMSRGNTSGRNDDNIDSIRKRFDTYKEHTLPVINYYHQKGQVVKIDGAGGIEEVWNEVKNQFVAHGFSPKQGVFVG